MIGINQLESTSCGSMGMSWWGSAEARAGKGGWVDIDMQDRLTLQGLDFNSKAVKQGLGLEFQGPLQGMWVPIGLIDHIFSILYKGGIARFDLIILFLLIRENLGFEVEPAYGLELLQLEKGSTGGQVTAIPIQSLITLGKWGTRRCVQPLHEGGGICYQKSALVTDSSGLHYYCQQEGMRKLGPFRGEEVVQSFEKNKNTVISVRKEMKLLSDPGVHFHSHRPSRNDDRECYLECNLDLPFILLIILIKVSSDSRKKEAKGKEVIVQLAEEGKFVGTSIIGPKEEGAERERCLGDPLVVRAWKGKTDHGLRDRKSVTAERSEKLN
ncbi:hypothetical protein VNO80_33957 [Phaseolus coccineus]|uniref:Uncharacterized protein n=1 Tax=Phaseolus coccineus TaxID=3886 RepID=A0AAN9KZ62_PHACN